MTLAGGVIRQVIIITRFGLILTTSSTTGVASLDFTLPARYESAVMYTSTDRLDPEQPAMVVQANKIIPIVNFIFRFSKNDVCQKFIDLVKCQACEYAFFSVLLCES